MKNIAIEEIQSSLEELANGVNPFTGEAAKEGDVLNDVRVSRCLFAASDLLKQLVSSQYKYGTKRHRFEYDEELNANIPISSEPITMSKFLANVRLAYGKETKFTYYDLLPFLLEKGLFTRNPEGRPKLYASEKGKEHGLENVRREGRYGGHWQTIFHEEGQRYVIELLKEFAKC